MRRLRLVKPSVKYVDAAGQTAVGDLIYDSGSGVYSCVVFKAGTKQVHGLTIDVDQVWAGETDANQLKRLPKYW